MCANCMYTEMCFQDASSTIMEELIYFHDHTLLAALLISTMVLYTIYSLTTTKLTHTNSVDAQEIEMVWTVMPATILVMIALPSLRILYLMDEIDNPDVSIKAIGHQWYWAYEYSDYTNQDLNFDSYMNSSKNLMTGELRLLEVNNRMIAPTETTVRTLITAEDVLHSWALPSLGVKTDAIPGRLTQTSFLIPQQGIYYGQCSEICGANHSFMPIVVEALPMKNYLECSSTFSQ